jgi:hypothetical protein
MYIVDMNFVIDLFIVKRFGMLKKIHEIMCSKKIYVLHHLHQQQQYINISFQLQLIQQIKEQQHKYKNLYYYLPRSNDTVRITVPNIKGKYCPFTGYFGL